MSPVISIHTPESRLLPESLIAALDAIIAAKNVASARTIAAAALGRTVVATASKGGAETFHGKLRAAAAAAPVNSHLVPGATGWAAIPSSLRSYKTARGTVIRIPSSMRVPAERYWPNGSLPAGIEIHVPSAVSPTDRARRMLETELRHAVMFSDAACGDATNAAEWSDEVDRIAGELATLNRPTLAIAA